MARSQAVILCGFTLCGDSRTELGMILTKIGASGLKCKYSLQYLAVRPKMALSIAAAIAGIKSGVSDQLAPESIQQLCQDYNRTRDPVTTI